MCERDIERVGYANTLRLLTLVASFASKGSKFDKRDFHEAILDTGTVPLYLLDDAIDQWIRDTLASPVFSGGAPDVPSLICVAIIVWQIMARHM